MSSLHNCSSSFFLFIFCHVPWSHQDVDDHASLQRSVLRSYYKILSFWYIPFYIINSHKFYRYVKRWFPLSLMPSAMSIKFSKTFLLIMYPRSVYCFLLMLCISFFFVSISIKITTYKRRKRKERDSWHTKYWHWNKKLEKKKKEKTWPSRKKRWLTWHKLL